MGDRLVAYSHRARQLPHRAEGRMIGRDDHTACGGVVLGHRLGHRVDGPARHSVLGQSGEPVLGCPFPKHVLEQVDQLVLVLPAVLEVAVAGVVRQLGMVDGLSQPLPELLLGAGNHDPAICRLEVLERNKGRVSAHRGPWSVVPLGQVPGAGIVQKAHGDVVEAEVAVHAPAVAPGGVDC